MGCWILYDKTLISLDALEDVGLLDSPFAYVCPFFIGLRVFFLGMGSLPPRLPIICELLEEVRLDVFRGLFRVSRGWC